MRNTLLALAAFAGLVVATGSAEARPYHRDHGYHHGYHHGYARGHHYGWRHHGPRGMMMRHHRWAGHHGHWR